MPKFRFKLSRQLISTVELEADDIVKSYKKVQEYIEKGGEGENSYYTSIDYDEAIELCPHCNEEIENAFGLPCCQTAAKERANGRAKTNN